MTLPASNAVELDAVQAAWLEAGNPPLPEGFQPTIAQMRDAFARQAASSTAPGTEHIAVQDSTLRSRGEHDIPIRCYNHSPVAEPAGCCVYVHGGGWVLGDLDTHHGICLDLCAQTGQAVIAIDYRRSPEHHFPAAIEDVVDVLVALKTGAIPLALPSSHIMLCGDSAGASLALSVCLLLRGTDALPQRLALVYPAVGADIERPSFVENRHIPGLTPDMMRFFFISYLGAETLPDPLAAPLLVDDLQSLPPVFISGAQFDPLRDDATDLAAKLQESGVDTRLRIEPGLGHGYLWVRRQSAPAVEAFRALVTFLSPGTH